MEHRGRDPLLLAKTIILDRGVIRRGAACVRTVSCHIDIARTVNGNGCGRIIVMPRSIVTRNPLLVASRVILDGREIVKRPSGTRTRHINIAQAIHSDGTGGVIDVSRSVVARDHCSCSAESYLMVA
jgi:hypothetical protein